ncbi:AraC family transcriptional regulator [Haloferula sp.]|uniref:AraC family transcriptional regulator n=1 Tax=Haloferula sp. TaxID=2497595 RepID=UPI003C709E00
MSTQSPDDAWESVDPLGEALHSLRMSGTFYCRSELSAPWGIDLPAMPGCLMFHIVTAGECRIESELGGTKRLKAGDFVLIPHGRGHLLKSDVKASVQNIFDLHREMISPRYELLKYGGRGRETRLICGAVCIDDPASLRLVEALPEMIVMRTDTPENDWLVGIIRLMMVEAREMRPGGDTVITRVSDILVVQAIRHWLENDPLARTGWLGALRDAQVGKAIALIHRHPTRPWSVRELAEKVGLSRSAFAARFMELVGDSPMRYVRHWRFRIAMNWLRDTDLPLAEMADQLSYQSEAAFNRAFKTFTGKTPGSVRREARKLALAGSTGTA